eukprot:CAMPEP_0202881548 /NCGR_PEP_ID=MMETSP1391-20130828/36682_1 /ASSEMBLY_ACC=CAM_ASM_000867 /TAXON_ID=1034604 /ORGANISM="Chlamydomonas leiostraca, Strain SAG 11-49" /LENGTH=163 /DNA_ID=CAMNT_0049564253 /DNA_START=1111 /DNA_END=1602 /DNA_ORIENTATION=-
MPSIGAAQSQNWLRTSCASWGSCCAASCTACCVASAVAAAAAWEGASRRLLCCGLPSPEATPATAAAARDSQPGSSGSSIRTGPLPFGACPLPFCSSCSSAPAGFSVPSNRSSEMLGAAAPSDVALHSGHLLKDRGLARMQLWQNEWPHRRESGRLDPQLKEL